MEVVINSHIFKSLFFNKFVKMKIFNLLINSLFLLLLLCCNQSPSCGQNLVLTPDFEEIVPNNGDYSIYKDTFYVQNWFTPTDGSVDIIEDYKSCNEDSIFIMYNCGKVKSGNYCVGLSSFSVLGYMEHIIGKLIQPLQQDKFYKVSFHLRFHGSGTPFVAKGMGFKLSKDSVVFKSNRIFEKKQAPFYYDLLFQTR